MTAAAMLEAANATSLLLDLMPGLPYLRFAVDNRRFLAFGFFTAFASSFGQTYFIGVFSPSIEAEFSLSHTQWAMIYLAGTLLSALVLPWSGKRIDNTGLRSYTITAIAILGMGTGILFVASRPLLLVLAIFLVRQGGQGLLSHISVTSMARYFEAGRGRAIALATMGFAAGEAFLPFAALGLIGWVGWRWSLLMVLALLSVFLMPLLWWLLREHQERHQAHLQTLADLSAEFETPVRRSWTRREVLADPSFYLLLPGLLAPALIITALFFTHLDLADAKNWSHAWITGSYVIYAGATTVVALVIGPLIDKVGGTRLVPLMLVPMAAGLLVAGTMREPWAVWPYFLLLGASIGVSHTAVSAMWAELYGVGSIGAIKSVVTALAVLASALGPVIMGVCRDAGADIEQVCLYFAAYAIVATLLLVVGLRLKKGRSLGAAPA